MPYLRQHGPLYGLIEIKWTGSGQKGMKSAYLRKSDGIIPVIFLMKRAKSACLTKPHCSEISLMLAVEYCKRPIPFSNRFWSRKLLLNGSNGKSSLPSGKGRKDHRSHRVQPDFRTIRDEGWTYRNLRGSFPLIRRNSSSIAVWQIASRGCSIVVIEGLAYELKRRLS